MRDRMQLSLWCSAAAAIALVLAPVNARAQLSEPAAEAPPPEAAQPEGQETPFEAPIEGPEPTPEQRRKARVLRQTGIGVMSTGGLIAAGGLGLTIAFTVIGDRRQGLDEPVLADIEQANRVAQIGGILLASGMAVVAIGGAIYARAGKVRSERPVARLRLMPTLRGLVFSGQF